MKSNDARRRAEAAELLALRALELIGEDHERLEHFVKETGITLDGIRAHALDPALLGCVLDYLLAYDDRVINFARSAGVAPAAIAPARQYLPGAAPEWN
jgi:hypothetical protein